MAHIPNLRAKYREEIIPALTKEFNYHTVMQVPKLEKIIINQGVGQAVADKKIVDTAQEELSIDNRSESSSDYVQKRHIQL